MRGGLIMGKAFMNLLYEIKNFALAHKWDAAKVAIGFILGMLYAW